MKHNKWDRRLELLAVLPAAGPLEGGGTPWTALVRSLALDWRVFVTRAPFKSPSVAVGGRGLDPLPIDTLPAVRKALAEQLVSGVLLIGEAAVLEHMEALHSFAPHIPFVACLGGRDWGDPVAFEYAAGWSDRIVAIEPAARDRLRLVLGRLTASIDVLPRPGSREWDRFVGRFSSAVRERFEAINAKSPSAGAEPEVVAFLAPESRTRWAPALREWRACLPRARGVALVPAKLRRSGGRVRRLWPGLSVFFYERQAQAVERANRIFERTARPRVLLLDAAARPAPETFARMSALASRHSLTAAVGAREVVRDTGEDFGRWSLLAHAWMMKHQGVYRSERGLSGRCALIDPDRAASAGLLDPALGWRLSIRDFWLRCGQHGWRLFTAEDALVCAGPEPGRAESQAEAFREAFARKWTVDPARILDGAARRPA